MIFGRSAFEAAIPEHAELFQRSFGRDLDHDVVRWRYLENPCDDLLAAGEYADGRLVASYSLSPLRVGYAGEEYLTALSLNTMTDPAYAGRGLFSRLAEELYAAATSRGYCLVWGFPNSRSHGTFVRRLGWTDTYEVPTLRLDAEQLGDVGRASSETDDDFQLDYGRGSWGDAELIAPLRTSAYLRWRYADHPVNTYANLVLRGGQEVRGYSVVKEYLDGLDIVDFQVRDTRDASDLLAGVLDYARRRNARSVQAWLPLRSAEHAIFERAGFANGGPVTYFGGRALGASGLASAFLDAGNWSLRMGDSDIY